MRGAGLVSSPAGTQSDQDVTIPFPLNNIGENELTVTVTAEDGVAQKTYTVTVTRALQFQLSTSLGALTDLNKSSYTVTGICDASISENVVVVMGDPVTDPQETPCETGNTFSASNN